jgi:hypothetical protein
MKSGATSATAQAAATAIAVQYLVLVHQRRLAAMSNTASPIIRIKNTP